MARTALYRYFDAEGTLLYVGITDSPMVRDAQHRASSPWIGEASRITYQWLESREHALALEAVAIRFEAPKHNVALVRPGDDAPAADISTTITCGAERLAAFFNATGVKRVWLAEKLGVSRSHITELCSGKKRPGRDLAFKIEDATGGAVRATSWSEAA